MKTKLDYYDGSDVLKDCDFKISPSGFYDFIYRPWDWYAKQVTKTDTFEGNTSTVIGTIVHYVAECVGSNTPVDYEEIERYKTKMSVIEDVNIDEVNKHYKPMVDRLINDYVLHNKPTEVEPFVHQGIGDNVVVAGSIDAIISASDKRSTTIVDYKTYNSKTKPRKIPDNYKTQLLCYAYILSKQGYEVDSIRLVYVNRFIDGGISEKTGKPLKSYPPEVTVLEEQITKEDISYIESQLKLCRDTYNLYLENKDYAYVLFKDPRLKDN